jgi:dipeptidyl-peptidase-4
MKNHGQATATKKLLRAGVAALLVVTVLSTNGQAQGTKEDYARADALRTLTSGKVVKARVVPHWYGGGTRFWYRNDLASGGHEFVAVDAAWRIRRPAFDHDKLAMVLGKAAGKPVEAARLPFDRIEIGDDESARFEAFGKAWRYDPRADALTPDEPLGKEAAPAQRPVPGQARRRAGSPRRDVSPDGEWTAVVKDHKIHLRNKTSGAEVALSSEGTETDGYEAGVYWSPDSKKLVALRTAKGDDRRVNLIESSPADQLQPKLQWYHYLKPGDRVPVTKPHLFDVESRQEVKVADTLLENPWSIDGFRWAADSSRFTFLYNQRGHQVLRLVAVDAATGAARALIDETNSTFIDYSNKTFVHYLEDSDDIIWMSERDGWNHLYLYNGRTGELKNRITQGEWLIRGVDQVDDRARQIWFRAAGIHPGQDPYHVHFARVNFDGTGLVVLTEGDGTHQVEFSPEKDRKYEIDAYSRVDMPPVTELRSTRDGSLVGVLERADWSALLAAGWRVPERFVAKGRDGQTDIFGVIYRPTRFDPKAKYPVIESIYAGPQSAFVPKAFAPLQRAQATAELGFIVVQIDGMGTNWRSKAFHDVCWKNLGDAGFPDRIRWMKAAAAKYPFMDLARVGVFGGSAGGQNAMGALLFHGDFYKAAAADCGCHDNRMDKIWWNEAWMGWPVGPEYARSSNVTNAHKLRGKLLLTVGELDRNVDPAATMQVVNALIHAGKDFEFVVFPGAGHGAGGGRYGERRRRDFFVKHLLGVDPTDRNAASDGTPVADR